MGEKRRAIPPCLSWVLYRHIPVVVGAVVDKRRRMVSHREESKIGRHGAILCFEEPGCGAAGWPDPHGLRFQGVMYRVRQNRLQNLDFRSMPLSCFSIGHEGCVGFACGISGAMV